MKDCFYEYRKGLYEALSTLKYKGVSMTVKEFAATEDPTPYIIIFNMNSTFERDDDKDSQTVTTDIMVVTSHEGDPSQYGSKESDDIMTMVMQKLITKGVTAPDRAAHIVMTNFTDMGCFFVNLNYQPVYDGLKTTIQKILTIQTMIDEN